MLWAAWTTLQRNPPRLLGILPAMCLLRNGITCPQKTPKLNDNDNVVPEMEELKCKGVSTCAR